jgi:ferredoxin-NADP reductase
MATATAAASAKVTGATALGGGDFGRAAARARVVGAAAAAARARVVGAAAAAARRLGVERGVDFWLSEIDPTWSLTALRARVIDVIDETADVKTFVLAPNGHWPGHRAGQFVRVGFEIEGARVERCYSLSSAPGGPTVAVTIKRVPGGRVSGWAHESLRRGDVVGLGPPAGDFVVDAPAPAKLLLVGGGSGVTPLMSIVRDRAGQAALRDVVFVHAARSRRGAIFGDELARLAACRSGLRVVFAIDDEGGRLDAAALRAAAPDLAEREAMLCGPAGMMAALAPVWAEAGVAHRLKRERFAPALRPTAPAGPSGAVRVGLARSGRGVRADGRGTLLEQLERAGERPAFGCRMGICNTCRCRKLSGVVEDVATGARSGEGSEDIRLCVSRPATDLELDLLLDGRPPRRRRKEA